MMTDQWIPLPNADAVRLHIRAWPAPGHADRPTFVLLHGLASNARTWDGVAVRLAEADYPVYAVDQRGHGLSDKPANGYDFKTVVDDLRLLLNELQIARPIIIGQSWGGNVTLAFGAAFPERAVGLGFIDGGYLDLQMRPNNTWDRVEQELKPPSLAGMPATALAARLRQGHPDWSDNGIDATMANFEQLDDGTIRPWLSLECHMRILRALWEQRPATLYPQVQVPVYIAAAEAASNPEWMAIKHKQVAAAEADLATVETEWYPATDHDIHVQKPDQLATALLAQAADGIWSGVRKGEGA